MALADTYARVIRDTKREDRSADFLASLLGFMKAKGHMSLLPSVVRILEREPERADVSVTVAREKDAKRFARSIEDSLKLLGTEEEPAVSIDPRIVGGYAVRAGSRVLDRSFRSALVTLYRRATRHG